MKTVHVKAKNGKQTPITLLTNWDLVFCVPIFIANMLTFYFIYPFAGRIMNLVGYPGIKLLGDINKVGKTKTWIVVTLNMVMLPLVYCFWVLNPTASPVVIGILTAVLLFTGLMAGEIFVYAINIQAAPPLGECAIRDVFMEEAGEIPEYLVDHKHSRGSLVASLFVTLHVVYNLIFLTLFLGAGWLYLAPLIIILQATLFTDKENIEHLASHDAGRIVRLENAERVQDYLYVFLNFLRKYIVWPLQLWSPNYYYATHTGIHHAEDNGPADFQSTLRFDQTSFVDFVKAVTWYSLFINIIPIDIIRYFRALKRKKFLNIFLRGYVLGFSFFALVTWIHPVLGFILFTMHVFSGLRSYLFVMRWHGFHDATRPYSVEASNNSPLHYGHHKEQNVHLMIVTECCRVFWQLREKDPKSFPIFVSAEAIETYMRNAMLVFFMMWQGKIDIITKFIFTDGNNRSELKKYVTGLRFLGKSSFMAPIDEKISKAIGKWAEKMHRKSMSAKDREFFDDNSPRVMMNIRVTNFRKLAIRSTDENMPKGVY